MGHTALSLLGIHSWSELYAIASVSSSGEGSEAPTLLSIIEGPNLNDRSLITARVIKGSDDGV
jgi:hypothetical protein